MNYTCIVAIIILAYSVSVARDTHSVLLRVNGTGDSCYRAVMVIRSTSNATVRSLSSEAEQTMSAYSSYTVDISASVKQLTPDVLQYDGTSYTRNIIPVPPSPEMRVANVANADKSNAQIYFLNPSNKRVFRDSLGIYSKTSATTPPRSITLFPSVVEFPDSSVSQGSTWKHTYITADTDTLVVSYMLESFIDTCHREAVSIMCESQLHAQGATDMNTKHGAATLRIVGKGHGKGRYVVELGTGLPISVNATGSYSTTQELSMQNQTALTTTVIDEEYIIDGYLDK